MRTIQEIRKDTSKIFLANYASLDEDFTINDLNRELIAAFQERHVMVWLGNVNLYEHTRGKSPIWAWNGDLVRNFECSFILSNYDSQLERMITERDQTPYTGTKQDAPLVHAIHDRIEKLNGVQLHWA